MMNGRVSSPEHDLFFGRMALAMHSTICTAATAGGLTLFLIFYHTHYDKDQDYKKNAPCEDSTHVLIQERDHKITLSP